LLACIRRAFNSGSSHGGEPGYISAMKAMPSYFAPLGTAEVLTALQPGAMERLVCETCAAFDLWIDALSMEELGALPFRIDSVRGELGFVKIFLRDARLGLAPGLFDRARRELLQSALRKLPGVLQSSVETAPLPSAKCRSRAGGAKAPRAGQAARRREDIRSSRRAKTKTQSASCGKKGAVKPAR